ncbi:MAG: KamA family radical SAM protein [Spirochaetaceae bacterium]|nr:MAG: KamA family radical SAM protein [Spirochaetaceae bacterium]
MYRVDPVTRLPYGVSRHFAALADTEDPFRDPIAAQYIPTPGEQTVLSYEDPDPIGDGQYTVVPRLVHHYYDRALLLVNDRCATYCRYCFRRHFTGHGAGHVTSAELETICTYLSAHTEIQEVLLSGGDPLMLADTEFFGIIDRLRVVRDLIVRVCTRMPVVLPNRISDSFARMLGERRPACMVVHVNHPRELTPQFRAGVDRLLAHGITTASQTVLLQGVNNDADVLEQLFRGLHRMSVRPYYLFQGDLASGTSHFRVDLGRGLEIMRILRSRLSGLALPTYAVDLPGGGGKVPVEASLVRTTETDYILRDGAGKEWTYPREPDRTGSPDSPRTPEDPKDDSSQDFPSKFS